VRRLPLTVIACRAAIAGNPLLAAVATNDLSPGLVSPVSVASCLGELQQQANRAGTGRQAVCPAWRHALHRGGSRVLAALVPLARINYLDAPTIF